MQASPPVSGRSAGLWGEAAYQAGNIGHHILLATPLPGQESTRQAARRPGPVGSVRRPAASPQQPHPPPSCLSGPLTGDRLAEGREGGTPGHDDRALAPVCPGAPPTPLHCPPLCLGTRPTFAEPPSFLLAALPRGLHRGQEESSRRFQEWRQMTPLPFASHHPHLPAFVGSPFSRHALTARKVRLPKTPTTSEQLLHP